MNAKISVFAISVKAIIYLLVYNLHDCTFNGNFKDFTENLGLYEGVKRPECNPNFTSEIEANDLTLRPALYR